MIDENLIEGHLCYSCKHYEGCSPKGNILYAKDIDPSLAGKYEEWVVVMCGNYEEDV